MLKCPTLTPIRVDGSDGCSNASVRTSTCLITSGLEPTDARKATRSSLGYLTAALASSRMLRHCSSLKRSDMADAGYCVTADHLSHSAFIHWRANCQWR